MATLSRLSAAILVLLLLGTGWSAPASAECEADPSLETAGVPWDEPDVSEVGSAPAAEPLEDDGWAAAHAAGSRVSHAAVMAATYDVALTPQVQYFLDRFTGNHREVVGLWVGRAGRYLGMIRDVLRERGMPEDLAFTAMIESGFKPDAVSRMGAKGMWQFMAGTARRYGLRVDRWVDERLDPEKSTVAAAAYLRDLHTMFGSWALAQAAYNAGEVKILRAIRLTGSRDFWTLAQSRYLKRETKDFVPQIQAATVIGRDPARYGFELSEHEPPEADSVTVPASTDLRRLAAGAGLSAEAVRALNPTLVRGVTPPGRAWTLRVPAGTGDSVVAALVPRRPPVVMASAGRGVSRASATRDVHIVRPRDTISTIAKRYGVSVRDVMRWNRLDHQDRIRPGDRLRVAAIRSAADR